MYFQKALKNSDKNVFSVFDCTKTDNLLNAIPAFFSNEKQGVHILVVCSSSNVGLPNEQELSKHFSKINDPCTLLPKSGKASDDASQRLFTLIQSNDYCTLLRDSVDSICRCYSANSAIATLLEQSLTKYPMTPQTVDTLKSTVEAMLKDSEGRKCCNTLFIIASLPTEFYSEFESTDHCFPSFIEYVVLGEDTNNVIEVRDNNQQLLLISQKKQLVVYEGIIKTVNTIFTEKESLSKEEWMQINKEYKVREEKSILKN